MFITRQGKTWKTFVILFVLLLQSSLLSSPTVIKDNRIRDLDATPSLGRGYSISTNTFQSTCLSNLTTTKASFDFDFIFEELKEDNLETPEFEGTFLGTDAHAWLKKITESKVTVRNGITHHNHFLLSKMIVNSYYSSLDEASASLSPSVVSLLNQDNLLGFFQSCGSYYVRSISRRSVFLTVFTYSSVEKTRNPDFDSTLRIAVKKLGVSKGINDPNSDFSRQAAAFSLRISTKAIGLQGNPDTTLISGDLGSFKGVINNAFKATQSEFTGRIVGMEVVPWVENVQFQAGIKLKPVQAEVEKKATKEGEKKTDIKKRTVYPYEQNLILTENAEFYMQIIRVRNARLNIYHKARLCKHHIDMDYRSKGPKTPFRKQFRNAYLLNHINGNSMKLNEFARYLDMKKIHELGDSRRNFSIESLKCLDPLIRNIRHKQYLKIDKCASIEDDLIYTPDEIIDGYCMPTISLHEEKKPDDTSHNRNRRPQKKPARKTEPVNDTEKRREPARTNNSPDGEDKRRPRREPTRKPEPVSDTEKRREPVRTNDSPGGEDKRRPRREPTRKPEPVNDTEKRREPVRTNDSPGGEDKRRPRREPTRKPEPVNDTEKRREPVRTNDSPGGEDKRRPRREPTRKPEPVNDKEKRREPVRKIKPDEKPRPIRPGQPDIDPIQKPESMPVA